MIAPLVPLLLLGAGAVGGIAAAEANLPHFSLAPEGFFSRLAQRFGRKDFDFEFS